MPPISVVTDIEADGPDPGRHSMLSFACVGVQAGVPIAIAETLPGQTVSVIWAGNRPRRNTVELAS